MPGAWYLTGYHTSLLLGLPGVEGIDDPLLRTTAQTMKIELALSPLSWRHPPGVSVQAGSFTVALERSAADRLV